MKKKVVLALLISCMVFGVVGCGKTQNVSTETTEVSQEVTYLTADDYDWKDFVTLGDYTGFTVEVAEDVITDEDVQAELNNLLSAFTTYEEVADQDTILAEGMTANISYTCTMDDKNIEDEADSDVNHVIGNYESIEGLNDALIGKTKGDTFELSAVMPDDYYDADMAGKTLVYSVVVNYVAQEIVPEPTDSWIAENTEYETKDAWWSATKEQLEKSAEDSMLSAYRQGLSTKIVEAATFKDFPQELLDSQLAYYKAGDQETADNYSTTLEEFITVYYGYESIEDYEADLKDYIQESLKVTFALEALKDAEGITVNDETLAAFKKNCMDLYSFNTEEELIEYYGEDVIKKACENDLIWNTICEKNTVQYISPEDLEGVEQ